MGGATAVIKCKRLPTAALAVLVHALAWSAGFAANGGESAGVDPVRQRAEELAEAASQRFSEVMKQEKQDKRERVAQASSAQPSDPATMPAKDAWTALQDWVDRSTREYQGIVERLSTGANGAQPQPKGRAAEKPAGPAQPERTAAAKPANGQDGQQAEPDWVTWSYESFQTLMRKLAEAPPVSKWDPVADAQKRSNERLAATAAIPQQDKSAQPGKADVSPGTAQKQAEPKGVQEERRLAEARRAEAHQRRAEEVERTREALKAEEAKKVQNGKKTEESRKAAEAKKAEEALKAEQAKKAAEAKKAEEAAKAEQEKKVAEARKAEEALKAEQAKKAAEAKKAEEAAKAEQEKKVAEARKAEEALKAEQAKKAAEAKKAEETAKAEQARKVAEARKAEETLKAEQARNAAEARKGEQALKAEQAKKVAEARKAETALKAQATAQARSDGASREPVATASITRKKVLVARKKKAGRKQAWRGCRFAGKRTRTPGWYTVRRGDTLSNIAKRHYGAAKSYGRIYRANRKRLASADRISPCQRLYLPPARRRRG